MPVTAMQSFSKARKNHALEHAAIKILSSRHRGLALQGHSLAGGFTLNVYGTIDDQDVIQAVHDARTRLNSGQSQLGIHRNCGTMLVTRATMAALAVQITNALFGRRRGSWLGYLLWTLPLSIIGVIGALAYSRSAGLFIQKNVTVDTNLGDLSIVSIERINTSTASRLLRSALGFRKNNPSNSFYIKTALGQGSTPPAPSAETLA